MKYQTVKILKEETYRSSPLINMTDNMVRVTFVCSRNEWHEIKGHLTDAADEKSNLCLCPLHFGDCEYYNNGKCDSPLI